MEQIVIPVIVAIIVAVILVFSRKTLELFDYVVEPLRRRLLPLGLRKLSRLKVSQQRIEMINPRSVKDIHAERSLLQRIAMRSYQDAEGPTIDDQEVNILSRSVRNKCLQVPLLEVPNSTPCSLLSVRDVKLKWLGEAVDSPDLWPGLASRLRGDLDQTIDNNRVYALRSVSMTEQDKVVLNCCWGKYDAYINSCEALNWSLAAATKEYATIEFGPKFSVNEHTSNLLKKASQIVGLDKFRKDLKVFDFSNRLCAIGVNTLTVLVSRRDRYFYLHDRGREAKSSRTSNLKKAEAVGTVHVVPAGSFQPFLDGDVDHDREFDIEFTIFREFAEELLSFEPDPQFRHYECIERVLDAPENETLSEFFRFFSGSSVKTFYLGMGLDLLTLKPEVMTVCLVDADALHDKFKIKRNWEGELERKNFSRSVIASLIERHFDERLLGAAAGTLLLAYQQYNAIVLEIDEMAQDDKSSL